MFQSEPRDEGDGISKEERREVNRQKRLKISGSNNQGREDAEMASVFGMLQEAATARSVISKNKEEAEETRRKADREAEEARRNAVREREDAYREDQSKSQASLLAAILSLGNHHRI